jgi:hypothetical protein
MIFLIVALTALASLIFFLCSKCANAQNASETSDTPLDSWPSCRPPVARDERYRNQRLNQHLTQLRADYIRVWRTYMTLLLVSDTDRSATVWQWIARRCQFEWTVLRLRLDPALKPVGLGLQRGQAASLGIRLLRAQLQLVTASSAAPRLSRG